MSRFVTPGVATIDVPSRAEVAAIAEISGIQTQTSNHRKGVTAPGINSDPTAVAALTEPAELVGGKRLIESAGIMQRVRNGSGAIVTVIMKGPMTAAPDVWAIANIVNRPNCIFYPVRRIRRRVGDAVSQNGAVTGDHWMRATALESG